jgi:hypothetical protein
VPVADSIPMSSMPSRRIKLAITCRFLISIDSGVNASRFSAHRIHLFSSLQVSSTAADVIAPSPTCLGRRSRRGVRIGIGTSINTGSDASILNHGSERQYSYRFKNALSQLVRARKNSCMYANAPGKALPSFPLCDSPYIVVRVTPVQKISAGTPIPHECPQSAVWKAARKH